MASVKCSFCGSDRPPVDDVVFRVACPACGGPRLPVDAIISDDTTQRNAEAALFRARGAVKRSRFFRRLSLGLTITSTLLYVLALLAGAHLEFLPVLVTALLWTSVFFSRRRSKDIEARRAQRSLDEAYALVGKGDLNPIATALPAHLRVATGVAPETAPDPEAIAAAEELESENALADFDRRLAEAQKRQSS